MQQYILQDIGPDGLMLIIGHIIACALVVCPVPFYRNVMHLGPNYTTAVIDLVPANHLILNLLAK